MKKLKQLASAALFFFGASAFAAALGTANHGLCSSARDTTLDLVNKCAPEAVVNVMAPPAYEPAILASLARGDSTVFDTTRPLAYITNMAGAPVANSPNVPSLGTQNSYILYGYGYRGGAYGGKRLAVVINHSRGSFGGLNAMVNTLKAADPLATGTAHAGVFYNETLTTRLLNPTETTPLSCTGGLLPPTLITGVPSFMTATVSCNAWVDGVRDYVNEFRPGTKIPRGVQLVALEVPPEYAPPDVISTKYKPTMISIVEIGVQGFGIVVNDKLLTALIARDIAAKTLSPTCDAVTGYSNLTPNCQPSIAIAEVSQFVNGSGNAATLFGDEDTTPVIYYARLPFFGTQAVSNIVFGGQGVSLALDKKLKPYANFGYQPTVIGLPNSLSGDYQWTGNGLTVNSRYWPGDVLVGMASWANPNAYALGLVSLEKVFRNESGVDRRQGGAFVKIDGFSPNSDGTNWDPKQRVGFSKGYPLQFNTVALINSATKDFGQINVVNALIVALKDPGYDLTGVAYLDRSLSGKNNWAKYTRSINAYAPLSLNK